MPKIVSNFVEVFAFKLVNGSPEYLLLKRAANITLPNIWQVITATIDNDEKAYETAIREVTEETGLTLLNLYSAPFVNSFYRHDTDLVYIAPLFIAEVSNGDVILSEEHTQFCWCDLNGAEELLYWYNQKENLKLIHLHITEGKLFNTLEETKKIKL